MTVTAPLAARQLAALFGLGAMLAFTGTAQAGAPRLSFALVGLAAALSACLAMALASTRWRRVPDLVLLAPAFALIGAASAEGLLPSRTYSSLFVVVFVWVGAHHPRGTSLWVLPVAAAAYVVPLVAAPTDTPFSLPGCVVTLSVCVVAAETIAAAMASRAAAEDDKATAAETLRVTLDSSGQPTYAVDLSGVCTLANRAAGGELGFATEELVGRNMHALVHHSREDGSVYPEADCPIAVASREGRSVHVDDEVFWRRDGTSFQADYRSAPVAIDGRIVGAVVTFTDITVRRRAERETRSRLVDSERAAHTDALTGIGNRRHAETFLARVRFGDGVAVIDVDHFKDVNDTAGHAAGDRVLADLARHLAGELRDLDDVARYGGEEFVALLAGAADRASTVLERLAESWASGAPGRPTFSSGVAVHRPGRSPHETLACADRAMYRAKAQGRNRVVAAEDPAEVRPVR